MIRRIGTPPLAGQRYHLRPGVYAILPIKRRFLLTAQVARDIDVQLPGGGIDAGESPLQALHREVLEEIGWRIAAPRRLGAFRRFVFMPEYDLWAEKLCHVYVAHPVRQIAEPTEPDHITLILSGKDAVETLGNDGDSMFMQQFISR
ncbi:NUDIX hydrolase [Sulfitobacter sp. M57]|uniref:NUDIX hydrolase n=1 Tax=unclassified Sulfitobacter TaxID=196795 RepID=UPI0023E289BD|nr:MULTISPECIES: NUDIX hydrolase [unclassified Sulfitobacter]MDF3414967.1 NUDIX hydrolase [Sulfitobacter sp. KE5]MDF3422448.1 NUDIX hydrolase [Sulfitobacter sp. KE43]MDF3433513.1 NUDIX hydrolase [Sulfitobacter sp. KE42]MDF3459153.1 NUDIX hydrolase [Sulfitobacter sp. S74]MDF3463052.1 NUDIX hydrolase [Sulfitobacter sp. Ks18]